MQLLLVVTLAALFAPSVPARSAPQETASKQAAAEPIALARAGDGAPVCGLGRAFHAGRRAALMERTGDALLVFRGLDGVRENLAKECAEEASIPPELAARAVAVGALSYRCERPEGLRDDVVFCFDLTLPPDFRPDNTDGEVDEFFLWPVERVIEAVRETEDFKFNVNLVVLHLMLRRGLLNPDDPDYQAIVEGLWLAA